MIERLLRLSHRRLWVRFCTGSSAAGAGDTPRLSPKQFQANRCCGRTGVGAGANKRTGEAAPPSYGIL